MKVKAILLDTSSIQRYIFAGDKLKTNIGASYMVDRVFWSVLVGKVLKEKYALALTESEWRKQKDIFASNAACGVASIGGGNALLVFKPEVTDEALREVVKDFTRKLLLCAPGLRTGAAIGELILDEGDAAYKDSYQILYNQLKKNQNLINQNLAPSYTGLTIPCSYTGNLADKRSKSGAKRMIASEMLAKENMSDAANEALAKKFAANINTQTVEYYFPQSLDRLGQIEAESYVAVVHIDGNNMGVKFSGCKDLQERKEMSQRIAKDCQDSFAELIDSITAEASAYEPDILLKTKDGKTALPIRPLILGGDDVTFVCNAKMALVYTKRYIESMEKHDIDCCGGIAIIPTNYPFFRGYTLAEQLCDAAKKKSRKEKTIVKGAVQTIDADKRSSWIDFALLHGEQAPELDQIRRNTYTVQQGNLHFGPYKINDTKNINSLDKLLDAVQKMRKLPNNKIKELRSVIAHTPAEIKAFMAQLDKQQKSLPQIDGWENYTQALWYSTDGSKKYNRTPYLDVIELLDFVLPERKEEQA